MTEKYQSQNGFVTIPVLRGQEIIGSIFEVCCRVKHISGFNAYILGGMARYCCSVREGEETNDIDVYCENDEAYTSLMFQLLHVEQLKQTYENDICISFKPTDKFPKSIQVIKPIIEGRTVTKGTMETILTNFDFTIVRVGIIDLNTALADIDFIHDDKDRLLRIKNIHCPITSMLRCIKYGKKGYWTRPSEAIKLFWDWYHRETGYREELTSFFEDINQGGQLTQIEIDELEKLLRRG